MEVIQYVDQIIGFGAGMWFTVLGYGGRFGIRSISEPQHQRSALIERLFQIIGPLLVALSLILAAGNYYTQAKLG
jgi:membrane protein DedA with SNARE-associated domain